MPDISETDPKLQDLARLMPCPRTHQLWTLYVQRHIPQFVEFLATVPIPQGRGSISTAEAFWLYRLVSELKPGTIVESGSANGWSSFVLAGGAPNANIACYDPHNRPDALPENASYEPSDWTSRRKWPSDTVAFFDDHCNQRKRLRQVQSAGLKHSVFHDVYNVTDRSLLSLQYLDLLGLAQSIHTFDPIWDEHPTFTDTTLNPQMYRWLTWVEMAPRGRFDHRALHRSIGRRRLRNPWALPESSSNWTGS